jgi:hypothetical protein
LGLVGIFWFSKFFAKIILAIFDEIGILRGVREAVVGK